jgi:hypothetical protein
MGSFEEDIDGLFRQFRDAAELQAWIARFLEDEDSAGQFPSAAFRRYIGEPADPFDDAPPRRVLSKTALRHWLQEYDLAQAINEGDIGPYLETYHWRQLGRSSGLFVSFDDIDFSANEYRLANLIVNGPRPTAIHRDEIGLLASGDDNSSAIWRRIVARLRALCAFCTHQAGKALAWLISTWHEGSNRVGSRPGILKIPR